MKRERSSNRLGFPMKGLWDRARKSESWQEMGFLKGAMKL